MSELSARLELEGLTAVPGGRLRYTVINDGSAPILTGEDYEIERSADDQWVAVEMQMIFRAIGYGLDPGQRRTLTARLGADLAPGRYRLLKSVLGDPGRAARPLESTVALAEFDVVNG